MRSQEIVGIPVKLVCYFYVPSHRYLDAFETFYRKLGSTMGTMSRPGSSRQNSGGRSILSFRAKDKSPKSVKLPEKVAQVSY